MWASQSKHPSIDTWNQTMWNNIANAVYSYSSDDDPPTDVTGHPYAYNNSIGEAADPTWLSKFYTYRAQNVLIAANAISFQQSIWSEDYPQISYWETLPISKIPADAWIEEVRWTVAVGVEYDNGPAPGTDTNFFVHLLECDNVELLGASKHQSGMVGQAIPYGNSPMSILTDTVTIGEGVVNARDAIQDDDAFLAMFGVGFDPFGGYEENVRLRLGYYLLELRWRGIEAISIPGPATAELFFGMNLSAEAVSRVNDIEGSTEFSMDADGAALEFIGGMSADFETELTFVADITKGINAVDTTGTTNMSMALSATIETHTNIFGDFDSAMSLNGELEIQGVMAGTLESTLSFGAGLIQHAFLSANDEGFMMELHLGASLGSIVAMEGTIPMSMSAELDVGAKNVLYGYCDMGMSLAASTIERRLPMAADATFGMVLDGSQLTRITDMSGDIEAALSIAGSMTRFYDSPALPENTIYYTPRDRTIAVGLRDRAIRVSSQQRN
jgi:hypothetical protein